MLDLRNNFKNHLEDILSLIFYILIITLSIISYIFISELAGIIMIICLILILVILFVLNTPGMIVNIKYPKLIKMLNKYSIIREDEIKSKIQWSGEKLHKAFFNLSKIWNYGPMVLFLKRQYIFINEIII